MLFYQRNPILFTTYYTVDVILRYHHNLLSSIKYVVIVLFWKNVKNRLNLLSNGKIPGFFEKDFVFDPKTPSAGIPMKFRNFFNFTYSTFEIREAENVGEN